MSNTNLKVLNKNLLDIGNGVIIHQVNTSKDISEGLSKKINEKYPEHYNDYINSDMFMGSIVISAINDDLGIMGFIVQDTLKDKDAKIDYQAFQMCLERLRRIYSCDETINYYMPSDLGCELVGGDWEIVSKMISDICPFITIVKSTNE